MRPAARSHKRMTPCCASQPRATRGQGLSLTPSPSRARHLRSGDHQSLSPAQKNAFLFNGADSLYFKAAKALSDVFEKKLEEFEREAEQINNPQLDTMERCRILLDDMRVRAAARAARPSLPSDGPPSDGPPRSMQGNPFSEWFRDPVDHEALGLTDYLQVIKEPQDLGSISKKLERNAYMSPEDFARDVRLVWQNAITYNSATSMCAAARAPC